MQSSALGQLNYSPGRRLLALRPTWTSSVVKVQAALAVLPTDFNAGPHWIITQYSFNLFEGLLNRRRWVFPIIAVWLSFDRSRKQDGCVPDRTAQSKNPHP